MKKTTFKMLSLFLAAAFVFCCFAVIPATRADAVYYSNTYTTVASLKDANGCSVMQGTAIGSTYAYSIKTDGNDTNSIIYKTNMKTNANTQLKNSKTNTYLFPNLGHANDATVTTLDDYSTLFIVSMKTGDHALVRITVDGSTAKETGNYTLMYNGTSKSMSGINVMSKDENNINFLFKSGKTYYKGSLPLKATSGTVELTYAFTLNTTCALINGKIVSNMSSFVNQGFGYCKGTLYVPVSLDNVSIILVYHNVDTASGLIFPSTSTSFRITSSAYSHVFEIESCGVRDNKLYFTCNAAKASGDGNYDLLAYFNEYDYSKDPKEANDVIVDLGDTFTATLTGKGYSSYSLTDSSKTAGTQVTEKSYTGALDQIWRFKKSTGGSYTIRNVATGNYLSVRGGTNESGTVVDTSESVSGNAQKFTVYTVNGSYHLIPRISKTNGLALSGTKTIISGIMPNDAQRFIITKRTCKVTLKAGEGVASVSGGGTFDYGDSVSISAVMQPGYLFDGWDGASGVGQSGKITASGNVTLTAKARFALSSDTVLSAGTTAADYAASLGVTLSAKTASGETLADNAPLGTGMKLVAGSFESEICVYGDIDGSASVDVNDLLCIKAYFKGSRPLSGCYSKAADTTKDGKFTTSDYIMIKRIMTK